jgi:hypothetical protein
MSRVTYEPYQKEDIKSVSGYIINVNKNELSDADGSNPIKLDDFISTIVSEMERVNGPEVTPNKNKIMESIKSTGKRFMTAEELMLLIIDSSHFV